MMAKVSLAVLLAFAAQSSAGSILAATSSSHEQSMRPLAKPLGTIDELVAFGCEGLRSVIAGRKPSRSMREGPIRHRLYRVGAIQIVTAAEAKEIIMSATIPASEILRLDLVAAELTAEGSFLSQFGEPSRKDEKGSWYGSNAYETAIVFVRFADRKLTSIDWSCG